MPNMSLEKVRMPEQNPYIRNRNFEEVALGYTEEMAVEEVYIVYRRSMTELPARAEEVNHATEEGIIFKLLNNPVQILGNEGKRVRALECVEMELGEPDDSGRRRPVVKDGSNFEIEVDAVIMAIGTSPNPLISRTTNGLDTNKWGCLMAAAFPLTFVYFNRKLKAAAGGPKPDPDGSPDGDSVWKDRYNQVARDYNELVDMVNQTEQTEQAEQTHE